MSRILLLVLALITTVSINSQTLYRQDFENGFGDMVLIDVDKKTPDPKVNSYTMAWNIRDLRGSKRAGSNSWFNPVGAADDWMITPIISGITDKTVLSWESFSADSDYKDTYEIRISENGGTTPADFTKVLTKISNENNEITQRGASLAAYAGKDIRIAFRNISNDKYIIFIDNIEVIIPKDKDVALETTTVQKYGLVGSGYPISFSFKNIGSTKVTSLKAEWTDGVETKTQTFSNLSVEYGNSLDLVFSNLFEVVTPEIDKIKVKILEINGSADEVADNNIGETIIHGLKSAIPQKLVAEEGTGTWCGWCPRGSVNMANMRKNYPDEFIGIAVHNEDPMANIEYDTAIGNFPGFDGYPSVVVNRKDVIDPGDLEDYLTNNVRNQYAAAKVNFSTSYTGATITVEGDITFNTQFEEDIKMVAVVIEDNVKGTGAGYNQTNYYKNNSNGVMGGFEKLPDPVPASQMVYQEVARIIPFGFEGRSLNSGTAVNADDVVDFSFDVEIPSAYKINEVSVVIFATDASGAVIGADHSVSKSVGVNDIEEVATGISLFPNPTNSDAFLKLNIENTEEVSISVYNQIGQEVASRAYGKLSGEQVLPIMSSLFQSGLYFVKLNVGSKQSSHKLIVE